MKCAIYAHDIVKLSSKICLTVPTWAIRRYISVKIFVFENNTVHLHIIFTWNKRVISYWDTMLKGNLFPACWTKQFACRYGQVFIGKFTNSAYQIWGLWNRNVAFYGDFQGYSSRLIPRLCDRTDFCGAQSRSIRDGLADGSDELGVLDKSLSLDSLTETRVAEVLLLVVAILPHRAVTHRVIHVKSR